VYGIARLLQLGVDGIINLVIGREQRLDLAGPGRRDRQNEPERENECFQGWPLVIDKLENSPNRTICEPLDLRYRESIFGQYGKPPDFCFDDLLKRSAEVGQQQ
jgi:hypothetical protein